MAADKEFRSLLGLQHPETRMKDIELVLRFSAFFHVTYLKYKPPMKAFLNNDMENHRNISQKNENETLQAFKNSVQMTHSLLGRNAFKRFNKGDRNDSNGWWEQKRFNASLYDIMMWGFTRYDKSQVTSCLDSIGEALIWLMTEDQDFIDSIELSTSSQKMVTVRFDKWTRALEQTIGPRKNEPRLFSRQLKSDLLAADPTCALCKQHIQDIDDAAVDHIEQYWLGGKTIPENARLTHRYCNWSRRRNDEVVNP